jgi:hypothetical protein
VGLTAVLLADSAVAAAPNQRRVSVVLRTNGVKPAFW